MGKIVGFLIAAILLFLLWKYILSVIAIILVFMFFHKFFFTGIIYEKDKNNKPKSTWV